MRIVFAGTPEFAVVPLRRLLDAGRDLSAVYTQPDRPAGRGRKLRASPVKELAVAHGIPVYQPETLKTAEDQAGLAALRPDLMVVVAYGLILPAAVLAIPRLGCVNIHASLLPRWRGAAPIQRALLAGDEQTGVTLIQLVPRLDAGPMLIKKSTPIGPDDTGGNLHDRLAKLGAEALDDLLAQLAAGPVEGEIQDESRVTYASKLEKAEAVLDWNRPAADLCRQVRAFNPWPVAETRFKGDNLRVWRAEALNAGTTHPPGQVIGNGKNFDVATGDGALRLIEVQLPGGNRQPASAFLNAHSVVGERLGG